MKETFKLSKFDKFMHIIFGIVFQSLQIANIYIYKSTLYEKDLKPNYFEYLALTFYQVDKLLFLSKI